MKTEAGMGGDEEDEGLALPLSLSLFLTEYKEEKSPGDFNSPAAEINPTL